VLRWRIDQRVSVLRQHVDERFAIRLREAPRPVVESLHHELALVHGAVMEPAQRDEVRELRLAAVAQCLT
jgi:hypothetical protein